MMQLQKPLKVRSGEIWTCLRADIYKILSSHRSKKKKGEGKCNLHPFSCKLQSYTTHHICELWERERSSQPNKVKLAVFLVEGRHTHTHTPMCSLTHTPATPEMCGGEELAADGVCESSVKSLSQDVSWKLERRNLCSAFQNVPSHVGKQEYPKTPTAAGVGGRIQTDKQLQKDRIGSLQRSAANLAPRSVGLVSVLVSNSSRPLFCSDWSQTCLAAAAGSWRWDSARASILTCFQNNLFYEAICTRWEQLESRSSLGLTHRWSLCLLTHSCLGSAHWSSECGQHRYLIDCLNKHPHWRKAPFQTQ